MTVAERKILSIVTQKPYFLKDNFVLYHEDSLGIPAQLPENSVDMIFADPSYNLSNGGKFTDYQVDDYLTHPTELYLFGDEGFISFDLLNYQFGYYICITYNNQEILGHIERLKSMGFTNPYQTLDYLAEEMDIAPRTDCKQIEG